LDFKLKNKTHYTMKKIVTLILTGLMCGSLLAQQGNLKLVSPIGTGLGPTFPMHATKFIPHAKGVTSIGSRWFNYGEACDVHNSGTNPGTLSTINPNYLFPDTTIKANFGTAVGTPFIHYLADVFDPKSSYFNDPLYTDPASPAIVISKTDSYTIDSVQIAINYSRSTAAGITDTLIVEIGQVPTGTPGYAYGAPITTNFGLPSTAQVAFKGIIWNQKVTSLVATGKQIYKVLLTPTTVGDTINGSGGIILITVPCVGLPAFPANTLAATSWNFKPGYTWIANVDNISTKNTVNFLSYQEVSGGWPTAYQKGDYNVSYSIPNDVLYNQSLKPNGYDSSYVPSFAYEGGASPSTAYPFEHHLVYYKTSCATCKLNVASVNDIKQNGFSIGDSYPNPVNEGNELVLPINLTVKAKAMIVVYDILGKQIAATEESNLNIGNNEVKLSTRNMVPGIYSVSVTVAGKVKSLRVVVTR
jgi:hypothetical protein